MTQPDMIDGLRIRVLEQMLAGAAFDGWTAQALERALGRVVETPSSNQTDPSLYTMLDGSILFPDGVKGVLTLWSARCDAQMRANYEALEAPPEKIREKITWLVRTRIEGLVGYKEAARRASATLALPGYAGAAQKMIWVTADTMWRSIADGSTDFNYYTKRATLSAVYLSTLMKWYADGADIDATEPYAATWRFLEDRIDNVMQFEKIKARAQKAQSGSQGVIKQLANLRYGRGHS